jgi:integrase
VAIEIQNIHIEDGTITFHEKKKGNRIRTVNLTTELKGELSRYIKGLPQKQQYLFPARHNDSVTGHIGSRTAYDIYNDLCSLCGIKTPIPIHSMRASAAKLMHGKYKWPIEYVARLLGDEVSTVQRYYTVPSDDEMKEMTRRI